MKSRVLSSEATPATTLRAARARYEAGEDPLAAITRASGGCCGPHPELELECFRLFAAATDELLPTLTTHADVLRVFDRAIEMAEAQCP